MAQKLHSLRQVVLSDVDEARQFLLVNIIERYLTMSEEEVQAFDQWVERQEAREVKQMLTVYEERGIAKGMRQALLKLLRARFGDLSPGIVARLEAIESTEELDALYDCALTATSLAELGMEQDGA